VGELDDALAEVGVDDLDPGPLQLRLRWHSSVSIDLLFTSA
jgi:hypothetical protein